MRILIYGINYAPELTGIGKYTGEMAGWFAENGHDVTAITALPYYPEWSVHPRYQGKFWFKEKLESVTVYRCPLYIPKQVTSVKRIIHEFSFLASIMPVWFMSFFHKKYDVVFCVSPPFHLGLLPMLFAKIKGAKFINHIQDLQVDAAKDLGMIRSKRFLDVMFGIEKFILSRADIASTISSGMQRKIEAKGIPASRIWQFPNWVDEDFIKPLRRKDSLREAFGISQTDFVILYSGNLGEKQGLEIILEVARHFVDRTDIYFVICGTGGGKEKLLQLAKESFLTQVKFFPLQPYEKLSALLATADIHLVLQKGSASDLVMPSKLTGILAAGGCAMVTALPGTTLYEVIDEYQMGILVEPESSTALEKAINDALSKDLSLYRNSARNYAEKFLSKTFILKQLEEKLLQLLS